MFTKLWYIRCFVFSHTNRVLQDSLPSREEKHHKHLYNINGYRRINVFDATHQQEGVAVYWPQKYCAETTYHSLSRRSTYCHLMMLHTQRT